MPSRHQIIKSTIYNLKFDWDVHFSSDMLSTNVKHNVIQLSVLWGLETLSEMLVGKIKFTLTGNYSDPCETCISSFAQVPGEWT